MPQPENSGRSFMQKLCFSASRTMIEDCENSTDYWFCRAAWRPESSKHNQLQTAFYSRRSKVVFGGSDVKLSPRGWMLCCILSTSLSLFSQTASTSLRGTIKDPSGALVPGARVTLSNNANGQTLTAEANSAGQYVFPQLPPARYKITATAQGF